MTDAPTPKTERERLAERLLASHRGWDRNPAVGIVFEIPSTALLPGRLLAGDIAISDEVWVAAESPIHVLRMLAETGILVAADLAENAHDGPRIAGCWLVVEAWQAAPDQSAEIARRRGAGEQTPAFADLVGSRECKEVLITDPAGRITWLHHERGGDTYGEVEGEKTPISGPVARAMRAMTRAFMQQSAAPGST